MHITVSMTQSLANVALNLKKQGLKSTTNNTLNHRCQNVARHTVKCCLREIKKFDYVIHNKIKRSVDHTDTL